MPGAAVMVDYRRGNDIRNGGSEEGAPDHVRVSLEHGTLLAMLGAWGGVA
jgi:hypothetical protein